MATKTENLDLWQWAQTDPVDVDEVNENFQKIDSCIGKDIRLEKLLEVTNQSAAAQMDVDLSGIDLSKYSALHIYMWYSDAAISTTNNYDVAFRLNNDTSESYWNSVTTSRSSYASISTPFRVQSYWWAKVILFPSEGGAICHHGRNGKWSTKSSSDRSSKVSETDQYGAWEGGTWETLETFNFYIRSSDYELAAQQMRMVFYGEVQK